MSYRRWHKNLPSYFLRGTIVRMLHKLFSWPPLLKFFLWQSIRNLCIIACNCRSTWNDRDWGQSRVVILEIIRTSRTRVSLINHSSCKASHTHIHTHIRLFVQRSHVNTHKKKGVKKSVKKKQKVAWNCSCNWLC